MRRSRHRADHDDPQYDAWVDSKIDERRERSLDDIKTEDDDEPEARWSCRWCWGNGWAVVQPLSVLHCPRCLTRRLNHGYADASDMPVGVYRVPGEAA